ncbi:hypothetical protein TNCV_4766971 [Trichonephila clavipes]|nr:hypothetical protein TNCV_4766971 [Trichonephila clavipes]
MPVIQCGVMWTINGKNSRPVNFNFTTPRTVSRHLVAMSMVKLKAWMSHALTKEQRLRHPEKYKSVQEHKVKEPFLNPILTVDKNGCCMTITRAKHSGCIKANLRNRSPNQTSIYRKLSSPFGGPRRPRSIMYSSQDVKSL